MGSAGVSPASGSCGRLARTTHHLMIAGGLPAMKNGHRLRGPTPPLTALRDDARGDLLDKPDQTAGPPAGLYRLRANLAPMG